MNESLQFLHDYCDFSDPNFVWVMKGISRNKDNPDNPDMHRFMRRLIIAKPEDLDACYEEIKLLAIDPGTIYRIYISLNSRNVVSAAFEFQKRLVDVTMGLANKHEDALNLSKKIGSLWKTELEQKHSRGTKRFLLDIDNYAEEPVQVWRWLVEIMKTTVHCCRKTVTGWAFVFDACDTRSLLNQCVIWNLEFDLQRDSMLFVEQFKVV